MVMIINSTSGTIDNDRSIWRLIIAGLFVIAFVTLMLYYGLPSMESAEQYRFPSNEQ